MTTSPLAGAVLSAVQIADLIGRPRPTPEQAAIIEAPLAPVLVVAGAGSGKTETMASRVVWLVVNGHVRADQVLGLTFTRKAAHELAARVQQRLVQVATALDPSARASDAVVQPTIMTYHSYAASIVAEHGLRIGVEPMAQMLGEASQWQLAAELVDGWDAGLGITNPPSTVIEAVRALAGGLDEHLLDPDTARSGINGLIGQIDAAVARGSANPAEVKKLRASLADRLALLDIVAAYRDTKRRRDLLDHGDQVAIAARLARQVPAVAAGERARYGVVLLDEYQDTSYSQIRLLSSLFGGGHPVTAVGDPNQSIYAWRGASASGLGRFVRDFRITPEAALLRQLATSWRNDAAILDVANVVSAPLRAASTVEVAELRQRPGAGAGEVLAAYLPTIEDEAAWVAEQIGRRWAGLGEADRPTAAVLCRKRSQFVAIVAALHDAGLPVQVAGLGGLVHTPEVMDVLALLTAAHDPSRGDAAARLLTGALAELGAADLHAMGDWAAHLARQSGAATATATATATASATATADGDRRPAERDEAEARSLIDAIETPPPLRWRSAAGRGLTPEGARRVQRLGNALRTIRSNTHLGVADLVRVAERSMNLDIEIAVRPGGYHAAARANLDALADVAAGFASSAPVVTLGAFLAWIQVAQVVERGLDAPVAEPDPAAVQVMTVHAAKGLEWGIVAVPGLVDGGLPATATAGDGPRDAGWLTGLGDLPFPLRGDKDDLPTLELSTAVDGKDLAALLLQFRADAGAHQLAEERRLAYVAYTRACGTLLLSGAWWGEGSRPRPPSLFLDEVRAVTTVDTWADEPGDSNPRDDIDRSAPWPLQPTSATLATRAAAAAAVSAAASAPIILPENDPRVSRATTLLAAAGAPALVDVAMPAHLSASAVVGLAEDPDAYLQSLRRPVPVRPSPQGSRGSRVHAWIEAYFHHATLVDLDDLPGADGQDPDAESDGEATDEEALRTTFLATPWSGLTPIAIEEDVETWIGGYLVRCRIDAVFPDPERPGGQLVIDWKTGAEPSTAASRQARSLQLAVYRWAWAQRTGLPVEQIDAAFCYLSTGRTVRPEKLADADELAAILASMTVATDG